MKNITDMTSKVYQPEQITEKICKSVFIAIPKLCGTLDCDKQRTVCIMNQVTKIILKVILGRLREE